MSIKEADLYQPIYDFFTELGYKVNGEVRTLDITAVKDDELIVIELKKALNMKLLVQGAKRQRLTDKVYLAILRPNKTHSRAWKDKLYLLRRLELGLIVVSFTGVKPLVQVVQHPKPFSRKQSKKTSVKKKKSIMTEIDGRHADLNIGGSSGVKLMTAYKENALHIACCLSKFGSMSTKKLRGFGTGQKTTTILYNNYYQWFERINKGVYALSDKGHLAIDQYKELADYYFKLIEECEASHC